MARAPSNIISSDFQEVFDYIKMRGLVPSSPHVDQVRHAKKIHSMTYVLILWKFRLDLSRPHRSVFIEEIASDALQILPQVMMGYSKTVKLLIRGIAENALRHLYFCDHPVEFIRMNRESKWYVTVEQLLDYARNHHDFQNNEAKFNAIAQISSIYNDLSAGVHGRTVRDLEMRTALRSISYERSLAQIEVDLLRRCVQAVNFIISIYHKEQLANFSVEERRLILQSMPPLARQVWNDHEVEIF